MDLDQINALTDEQKERYVNLTRIFDLPGWQLIKTWATNQSEELLRRGANAVSWEANRLDAGQRVVYDLIAQLPEITELEYATLAEQNVEQRIAEAQAEDEADFE